MSLTPDNLFVFFRPSALSINRANFIRFLNTPSCHTSTMTELACAKVAVSCLRVRIKFCKLLDLITNTTRFTHQKGISLS